MAKERKYFRLTTRQREWLEHINATPNKERGAAEVGSWVEMDIEQIFGNTPAVYRYEYKIRDKTYTYIGHTDKELTRSRQHKSRSAPEKQVAIRDYFYYFAEEVRYAFVCFDEEFKNSLLASKNFRLWLEKYWIEHEKDLERSSRIKLRQNVNTKEKTPLQGYKYSPHQDAMLYYHKILNYHPELLIDITPQKFYSLWEDLKWDEVSGKQQLQDIFDYLKLLRQRAGS